MADAGSTVPAAPASATIVVAADVTSKMTTATNYYAVSAFGDAGESLPVMSSAVASLSGSKNTITIARVATNCIGYRIYRGTLSDGSDAYLIATVPQTPSLDPTMWISNQWRPNHGMGLILHLREEDIALAQMAPRIKFPLAVVNTTIEFLLLLYHVIAVKAHERMYIVKNIGPRA